MSNKPTIAELEKSLSEATATIEALTADNEKLFSENIELKKKAGVKVTKSIANEKTVVVKFLTAKGNYVAGDIAGFPESTAKDLIKREAAEAYEVKSEKEEK